MYVIGPNVCELPSVPIKLTDVSDKLIEGLESALEHRNSASQGLEDYLTARWKGLALVHVSTQTRKCWLTPFQRKTELTEAMYRKLLFLAISGCHRTHCVHFDRGLRSPW